MACAVVLPLRLPYQFLPLRLLALSGRKAEKSERKGFEMMHCIHFVHDVIDPTLVGLAMTSDQRDGGAPIPSKDGLIGKSQHLLSRLIFLNLSSADNQAQN